MKEESSACVGASISHYRIRSRIGAGGMGEVYLADDTKLNRPVALKVLSTSVASDKDRMRRFVQEAKAASALSHSNVVHVYEIGEFEGLHYIAMEHVDGQTLTEKLGSGPLAVADVCRLGAQIADALQEAHSKGIVHRDVKPANIMVTKRGQVKVLDFGIAKMRFLQAPASANTISTFSYTQPGIVMGTVQYMSPEQALGRAVDHRSDIFSLGMVLYEMAAGRPPFSAATPGEMLDRIINANPETITRFNASVSQELERIIAKCLRKDPAERYQTAADLHADLEVLARGPSGSGPSVQTSDSEYHIPRTLARLLFALLQCLYLGMYVSALVHSDGLQEGFAFVFDDRVAAGLFLYFTATALVGMAVRLFLCALVIFDHARTGVQFRKAFPAILALDATWAAAPLSLSLTVGPLLALAFIPPLAYAPFSQRTLIRSAYDLNRPVRTSTGAHRQS